MCNLTGLPRKYLKQLTDYTHEITLRNSKRVFEIKSIIAERKTLTGNEEEVIKEEIQENSPPNGQHHEGKLRPALAGVAQ